MPCITIIAAVTSDGAIGKGGKLLYHISADLKRFRQLTMGHAIIMGRKTFESFPNGALPGRRNIVVTRTAGYTAPDITTAASLQQAIRLVCEDDCFVIGGGEIYRTAIQIANRLDLTMIKTKRPDADTFFPKIDDAVWHRTKNSDMFTDPKTGVEYQFVTLERTE